MDLKAVKMGLKSNFANVIKSNEIYFIEYYKILLWMNYWDFLMFNYNYHDRKVGEQVNVLCKFCIAEKYPVISQLYASHISVISMSNISNISDISLTYLGNISVISCPNFSISQPHFFNLNLNIYYFDSS